MNQESPNTFPFPGFASAMPATDSASLEGLSKDEVRAWALRKSEEYRLLSYTMLSLHNAAAPIHTLPVELLMKIFGMTWSPRNGRQGLHPTSVCRRWRTVYLSAPAFWAEAVADVWFAERHDGGSWVWGQEEGLSSEFLTMLLDRSSPHPIALHVEQTLRGARDLTLPTCLLPSTVFPHLNHVVSLYANVTLLHLHVLHRVLDAGMVPTLEELIIYATAQSEPPDLAGMALASLRPVSDESLPRLCTLRLDPAIFFPLIAVRSLKSLCLDSYQDMSVNPTVPWPHPAGSDSRSLFQVLSHCRNLEYLYLEYFRRSRWWPPLGSGRRSESGAVHWQLPFLKELSFGIETSAPCALAALAVLDPCIPSTASVRLGPLESDEPDSLSTLMPSYLVHHHPFDTVILSPSAFNGSWTWIICCFAAQSLRLDIRFQSEKNLADHGIEAIFRTVCVTQLEIIPDSNQYRYAMTTDPVEDWAAVLRAFPHLTHLTASGVDTPSGVVDALGAIAGHGVTADSDVLASGSPLCPVLRNLTLGWEVPLEIGPKGSVEACDPALYRRHQDVGTRVEQRCSAMQPLFERRASMNAQKLHALEFYEYERQGYGREGLDVAEFGVLIASSRRDDDDLPCLERLQTVVGGPVVYRGYLLKTVVWRRDGEI
ncbi:hypothetical protein LXA43DRAFT_1109953 [Ganoderma leucocontextum]|nr:hypothetical protein LXA43DRAFT_1109953 [Ganoderma leucocontextum]